MGCVVVEAPTEFGLPATTVARLRVVLAKHPSVFRALIYGSRAKGNYRPGSDIDLTLDAPELSFAEFLRIEQDIDDLLLPYQVDLSRLADIEQGPLREHIERVGRVLWARGEPVL
ncbi:MAG: nucleotidyltransferase domain-containing protein [Leptothrix sp. (in: b-proteobacteria)]